MKFSKILSTLVLALIFLTACEKELSVENGGSSTATAVGTLKDSLVCCKPTTNAGS